MPWVLSMAEAIWGGGDSEDWSAEICLDLFPFLSSGCLDRVVIKLLGIMVMVGSILVKAPILLNIWKTQSVAGLAKGSTYGEVFMYSNQALYCFLMNYPFTVYGENIALLIQSLAICLLTWHFASHRTSLSEMVGLTASYVSYVTCILLFLPKRYYPWLVTMVTPLVLFSRGSQVWENFKHRHTGTNSIVTTTLNLMGNLVRIMTTISEVGWDFPVLVAYFAGTSVTFLLLLQFIIYRKNTQRLWEQLQEKQSKQKSE